MRVAGWGPRVTTVARIHDLMILFCFGGGRASSLSASTRASCAVPLPPAAHVNAMPALLFFQRLFGEASFCLQEDLHGCRVAWCVVATIAHFMCVCVFASLVLV